MAKILIAEDERDIRDLITFTLRFAGHEVVATSNGEEAFFKAQEVKPDLILMDVRMPRMTGYEACRKMKEIEELKSIPVVFLSAKGQESEVQAGLEAGAVEYILKPFAPDQLTSRVTALLEMYGTRGGTGTESGPGTGSGTERDTGAGPDTETWPRPGTSPRRDSGTEPKPGPDPERDARIVSKPLPGRYIGGTEPLPDPEIGSEPDPETGTGHETGTEPESGTGPEADSGTDSEFDRDKFI